MLLTVVFAAIQAKAVSFGIGAMAETWVVPLVSSGSIEQFERMAMVTLFGGSLATVAAAFLIERHGLVGGVPAFVALVALVDVGQTIDAIVWTGHGEALLVALNGAAAAPVGFGLVLRSNGRRPAGSPALPVFGAQQVLTLPAAALGVLGTILLLGGSEAPPWTVPGGAGWVIAAGALALPTAVALALAFAAPSRVAAFTGVDRATATRAWRRATARSIALLGGVLWLDFVGQQALGWAPAVGWLLQSVIVVAVAMDAVDEWRARGRDLVPVWPLHRVYAVEPVLRWLEEAGVPGSVRGLHLRTLFHFFAPWAAIDVLVAPEDAARAYDVIASKLGGSGGAPADG